MLRISEYGQEGPVTVVAVAGALAGEELGVLAERAEALQASAGELVLDLREVTEIDERGCELLLSLREAGVGLRRVPQFVAVALRQRAGGSRGQEEVEG